MRHVIVGGGTAGYLTALLLNRRYPFLDITVVASESIGVVGPGEGLTPQINRFLQDLNISIDEFLTETNGTFKNGIHYENWGVKNSSYFHSFYDVIHDEYGIFDGFEDYLRYVDIAVSSGDNLDKINLQDHVTKDNRVMTKYPGHYAFHIDSNKLILFLKKKAVDRGIKVLDEVITDIVNDQDNNITSLVFESGKSIGLDFIYDCSGFHRLIIGKHYKDNWISVKTHLPSNSAIAGQLPYDDIPLPYTTARAMSYGWSWKIPLQNRYGCGYVFDNTKISFEQAEEELREAVGSEYKLNWKFNFDSGFFSNPLIKNCLALGLSSSFFEPLEATAIDNVLNNLYRFLDIFAPKYLLNIDRDLLAAEFNSQFRALQYTTMAFLYLHYMTNKTNTSFWADFVKDHPIPDYPEFSLKSFLDKINNKTVNKEIFNDLTYRLQSWISVYYGNELGIQKELDKESISLYNHKVKELSDIKNDFQKHSEYLKNINNKNNS